ncbi:hypothetical protein CHUAL_011002 [Chamberlinius hualienensis]
MSTITVWCTRISLHSLKPHIFIILCTAAFFLTLIYYRSIGTMKTVWEVELMKPVNMSRTPEKCNVPSHIVTKGDINFTAFLNFIPAEQKFNYNESITFVTHASYGLLRNILNVTLKWNGPISVAVYAPSSDFYLALYEIAYLRQCSPPLVGQLVTFNLYYETIYKPDNVPCNFNEYLDSIENDIDCDVEYDSPPEEDSFKMTNNLTYPVNVGRNLARNNAETKYVLVADIELYPSENIIPWFLRMVSELGSRALHKKVFVLPIFEVNATVEVPTNKSTLVKLVKDKLAVSFHHYVCDECHRFPKLNRWLITKPKPNSISILHTTYRRGYWEPVYIGTNDEPLYDDRLNWEGMSDKMTQAFELCLQKYKFSILENAFLVHAPGIKAYDPENYNWREPYVKENNCLKTQIQKEIIKNYKRSNRCLL